MNKTLYGTAWALVIAAAGIVTASGQGTLYTIISNGPPAARFNIVVLAEGYTSAQGSTFRTDVTNTANSLFSRQPWEEYRPYCNVYAIAVASQESGTDHPAWGQYVATYFNSAYDTSDRGIAIPQNSTGQGRVDALIASLMPECDVPILLVNDPFGGGSEGGGKLAISAISGVPQVLVHELGHVVANLGDEYSDPFPSYPDTEEPNTTRETVRERIKWKAWIEPSTPIPTPLTTSYADAVGLFEGAHYHATGWYRPKQNCTMQSQWTPEFCEVCREALSLAIWKPVRRMTSWSPASASVTVNTPAPLAFAVSVVNPATHALDVQWLLDGTVVTDASGAACTLLPANLPNGNHILKAVVSDNTPFVRTDPANLRRETNSWSLAVNILRMESVLVLPGAKLSMVVKGSGSFALETSEDFLAWRPVSTNAFVNGSCALTNNASGPRSFYRARGLP